MPTRPTASSLIVLIVAAATPLVAASAQASSAQAGPALDVRSYCDDGGRCFETDDDRHRGGEDGPDEEIGGQPIVPGYGGYERDDDDDRLPPPPFDADRDPRSFRR